jgi:catecholate siderophore receptor
MYTSRKPFAAAAIAAFTVPFALPAFAQVAAQPAKPAQPAQPPAQAGATPNPATAATATTADTTPAAGPALPVVNVTAGAEHDNFQVERSSVGAKTPTALRDIAQSVTVVDKAVLQSQGLTSFQDALRNVPGITLGAAEGGSIGNNVNLRGFTARTDIYLDGFRDRGQYYRDTFDLDSIEVLYGPSSMLFGRGSTGGVINQVSKKPNLTPSNEVSATVGTQDHYRTTVDLNHPLSDTAAVRINAFAQDNGSTRDVMKSKDYGLAPSVRFGIGTPTEVTLSALIEHNRDQPDYGVQSLNGHPAPVGRNTFYGLTDDRTIQDVQILSARIEHRFNDNVTLRNQTQFAHYSTDARETAPGKVLTGPLATSPALTNGNFTTLDPSQLFVALASHDRVINDHSIYNSTDLITQFTTGPLRHKLVTGVELGRDTYSNQSYSRAGLPIVSLVDPLYQASPASAVETAGNLAQASANSFAAYANDTVSIGKQWKVVGGLRWDRFKPEISNTITAPANASQTNNFTSVRAGIIYQPTLWQSYYVSYGTSFDPSLEALTLTNTTQNLAPESNRSYEVGSKWDLLDGNLSLTQSLFDIKKTNARTQTDTGEYELSGDLDVKGYQIGVAGHITNKWQVFGGYTYLDSRVVKAADGTQGNAIANTPRHTFTLWSTYDVAPHWQIGGGPTFMSSRYAANTNYVEVGGYTRWDATVAYHQKKYDIRLNLLNLTNKYYYDSLIQSDGGRAVPAIGRTLLATVNYRF